MAISNSASGLRPGVCTSTTRPTAPFDGQVIYETDTKQTLVWQGSAWVMLTDADQPPGLQIITPSGATNGTVTGNGVVVGNAVPSVTVSGVFSAEFDNYKIIYNGGTASANTLIYFRLGATTTGYYVSYLYNAWNNTTSGVGGTTATAFERFGRASTTANNNYGNTELYNPYLSANTRWTSYDISADGAGTGFGFLNNTTSYTDFNIFPASGTLTGGTIRVYGYRNS